MPTDASPAFAAIKPMNTSITRLAAVALVACSLVAVRAQSPAVLDGEQSATGKAVRVPFQKAYPPDRTYAVIVRRDLPTIAIKGSRESSYPLEIVEGGWKGPGAMFRAKPVGNLAFGEVMKVERVDIGGNEAELTLVSVDALEISTDADHPERKRVERVTDRVIVPHRAGLKELIQQLDPYMRLFPDLDQAREYARSLAQPQPDRRFTLAVVRRDGVLLPIASYDNGHWFRRWPSPATERDVPMRLEDVPGEWWGIEGPAARWTLWTPDGKSRPLDAGTPLAFGAHCLMNVGLRTNYKSPFPAPQLDQHHYPKDGIATTGTVPIDPVTAMTMDDPAWAGFENQIAPLVARLEMAVVWRVPMAMAAARGIAPVKLEVMCVEGQPSTTRTVYFEAARRYEATATSANPDPCGVVTFASGWVHRAANGTGVMDRMSQAVITDCSMWNAEFGRPLGVMRVGGDTIWVMEITRWGGERYDLMKITDKNVSVILSVPGGACRSLGD